MIVGINYPWIHCGWDFGDPPPAWVAPESLPDWRRRKRDQIEADFRKFASQGIVAVRWFVLANGMNYGMDELAPHKTGDQWDFDPLPAGHPFHEQLSDDFEFVLQTCARTGLKFFPSLIDFQWCHQGNAVQGSPGIISGGRYDIIRSREKRLAFFERILDPLLEISAQYRDSIYAWELMNEPEWVIRKSSVVGKKEENSTVSLREMKQFIAEGISRINSKQLPGGAGAFKSSVGFAHWHSLGKWNSSKLGITLPQFHYYAQKNSNLPRNPYPEDLPCVLGEFATAVENVWPDLRRMQKDQTVANRLSCIRDKGYPACFLWSARAVDVATRWTADEHHSVMAYTASTRPDNRA